MSFITNTKFLYIVVIVQKSLHNVIETLRTEFVVGDFQLVKSFFTTKIFEDIFENFALFLS